MGHVEIFDTTLRDGCQLEGVSVTVEDKLRIAEQLDQLGVHYIEGGWPGANPKDEEFFRRAAGELRLGTSTLVAFGSTRRAKGKVDDDATLRNLVEAGTSAVCIVGKSWDYHVTDTLGTSLAEGEAMVSDSVEFLVGNGLRVLFDAEHFFDGYKRNPEFALRVLEAAAEKGATHLVLCDTNGGSLPFEVEQIVAAVKAHFRDDATIAIHTHDDTGCAVANAIAAVQGGRPPGPGHDERAGGAHRQLQPHDGHPQPQPEDGVRHAARRSPAAADRGEPPHRRAGQPAAQPAGAVRRRVRVRAQGRPPRLGHRQAQGRVRARRSGVRRQRDQVRRQRDGRPGHHQAEGRRDRAATWTAPPSAR